MRKFLPQIAQWIEQKRPFAVATVIGTWGSAPQGPGSWMLIREDMEILGSISGGCVENAVIEEALGVLDTRRPKLLSFDVNHETAWDITLSCGGRLQVLIEPHLAFTGGSQDWQIWEAMHQAISYNASFTLLTLLEEPSENRHLLVFPDGKATGNWGDLTGKAMELALACHGERASRKLALEGKNVFAQVFPRLDHLIIVGGNHISVHLLVYAAELEFFTTLIEPRKVFSSSQRFPVQPNNILRKWPDEALKKLELDQDTYAVLLSHDIKLDDSALHILLRSPVAYIGALGSRKTHAARCARLIEAGFSENELARIHGPVGINICAKTPAEIALSTIAQIIECKRRAICAK